jgi:hypothetical protein
VTDDVRVPDTRLELGHPLLQLRLPLLEDLLRTKYGWATRRIEIYRPELRQQWLYGAGRTVGELAPHGISAAFARPTEPRVTKAWSATVSAHGFRFGAQPASCAVDLCPLGADGRPFTRDDPWEAFVRAMAIEGPAIGLVHFHAPGKDVWDKPHLELLEWSNGTHTLTGRQDPGD